METSNFWQDFLGESVGVYGEIRKSEAAAEAEKYNYLSSIPRPPVQASGDPNQYREIEPTKGQDSDGSTLVAIPNKVYGGLPLWAWGAMALTFLIILMLAFGRRGK